VLGKFFLRPFFSSLCHVAEDSVKAESWLAHCCPFLVLYQAVKQALLLPLGHHLRLQRVCFPFSSALYICHHFIAWTLLSQINAVLPCVN
jgi:hypothetical protein